jgi:hypothetical protein
MMGDERVRYCSHCKLNVYNPSAMTEAEIQSLIANREGRLCGRLFRRTDGTLLTQDCPVGFRTVVKRISRVAGAILSAAMSLNFAAAQTSDKTSTSLVQIDHHGDGVSVLVTDPSGAVIRRASVTFASSAAKNETRTILTDREGVAKVSNLSADTYQLTVAANGFETTHQGVHLSGQDSLHVSMEVGQSVTMGVFVMPLIETEPTPLPDRIPLKEER